MTYEGTHMIRAILLPSVVAMMILLPSRLWGQGGEHQLAVKHRNDCRLAAQVLGTGHPAPHREWALRYIANCEGEGPAVLAALWRSAPNSGDVETLVRSSLRLRDARLYNQLRETAGDRSRPGPVRVGAMLVLARYTDPRNAIWLTDLVPPDSIRQIRLVPASSTGFHPLTGDVPLRGPIAPSVLTLLEGIAAARTSEPREVWYAAAVLAKRVRRDVDAGFAH
jgi:hypothetical protein